MTVAELIAALQRYPGDMSVEMFTFNLPGVSDGIWSPHPIKLVEQDIDQYPIVVQIIAED